MGGFDETFDWVVVGSGAGSMVSALVMRKAGYSVAILEKTPFVGGTTAKSGGVMWIPNNRFIRAEEPDESADKAITYLDAVCEDLPGSNHEKRLAYVNEAPRMLDFLIAEGIEFERGSQYWTDYYDDAPGGCSTSRTVTARYFNLKELGAWEKKLRPGFLPYPTRLGDGMKTAFRAKSKEYARIYRRTVLRTILGKLAL